MSSPLVAVAQLGARHHYAVPRALHEEGILERFYTDGYSGNKPILRAVASFVDRFYPTDFVKRWLARSEPALPQSKVTSFEHLGLAYSYARRSASDSVSLSRTFAKYGKAFNEAVLHYGLGDANLVFGFNGASLELFEFSKKLGKRCVLDQTIASWSSMQRHISAQAERWPDWQPSYVPQPPNAELLKREMLEWSLADVILCPSTFVRDSIEEVDGPIEKCRIVPYATDLKRFRARKKHIAPTDRRLRVLFVGEVGLRKGVPDLLTALRLLGSDLVEARLVGIPRIAQDRMAKYSDLATFVGPVPRSEIPEHFAWADVFVFPSVCEGSAAVLSEALATGLPIICTPNSGPPHYEAGVHLVEVGNPHSIAAAIENVSVDYLQSCPTNLSEPPFAPSVYRARLGGVIRGILN